MGDPLTHGIQSQGLEVRVSPGQLFPSLSSCFAEPASPQGDSTWGVGDSISLPGWLLPGPEAQVRGLSWAAAWTGRQRGGHGLGGQAPVSGDFREARVGVLLHQGRTRCAPHRSMHAAVAACRFVLVSSLVSWSIFTCGKEHKHMGEWGPRARVRGSALWKTDGAGRSTGF